MTPARPAVPGLPAGPAEAAEAAEAAESTGPTVDARRVPSPARRPTSAEPADLLDGVPRWGAMPTPEGDFRLVPVRLPRDLDLVAAWMNDPVVAAFWELAGPADLTEHHIRAQLDGDGRSVPCLGTLDGVPMSYWEVYRADLDPLARHYPARPHDTGVHLLLGPAACRGRGLGGVLLRALTDRALARRPAAQRVVAEPDVRNLPSLSAFRKAGFRRAADLDLPGKRAALMIRDRLH